MDNRTQPKFTMTNARPLTPKEQKVIQEFESARPGLGTIAQSNILNDKTGWADIIADTPEEELVISEGSAANSFIYGRIGG
jgi:hypothetical protein